jgi:hypothetical protein
MEGISCAANLKDKGHLKVNHLASKRNPAMTAVIQDVIGFSPFLIKISRFL